MERKNANIPFVAWVGQVAGGIVCEDEGRLVWRGRENAGTTFPALVSASSFLVSSTICLSTASSADKEAT